MSFTITRKLEQVPSYSMLSGLAEKHQVHLAGNERTGSFSSRDVEGDYAFDATGLGGTFAGSGVRGEFSFKDGLAVVTIIDKPFWLPEKLLKQKITEGLDVLGREGSVC